MFEGRTKIISFRVSEHEFEAVQEASRKHGFSSVAFFARAATIASQLSEPIQSSLDIEISRLHCRIEALTAALEKLAARAGLVINPFV